MPVSTPGRDRRPRLLPVSSFMWKSLSSGGSRFA
jgi:hypothetical protein